MDLLAYLVLGCSTVASVYQLVQGYAARRYLSRARAAAARPPAGPLPAVTILKPLKGPGLDLYANLASFCRQDYPAACQIVFGVAEADDPAAGVVERIRRDFPDRDIVLSIGSAPAANRKVGNLIAMMRHARHGVVVLSDADIRVRPDYLRAMVAPLADPTVGLVTSLYRGRGYFGLPSVIESLYINSFFIPMVMMAQLAQEMRYALGASVAIRRTALDAIGGFAAAADYLADDYIIGNRIFAAGHRVVLIPYVVETVLDSVTLTDVGHHLLRWARTNRYCQPANWFFTVITHTVLWGVLAVAATGGAVAGWLALGGAVACRLGSLRYTMHLLRERDTPRHLWAVPLSDLGCSVLWALSWLGHDVHWSGLRLRVLADGRMVSLDGKPPALALEPASMAGRGLAPPAARAGDGAADARG